MFSSNTSSAAGDANFVEEVFQTWLYTGTGATQTITNGIDLSTKGGLVWTKTRNAPVGHGLVDTVRGGTKLLQSDTSAAEDTFAGYITSFNANGYTLGASGVLNDTYNMVSWTFREQPKFFDVVTGTCDGSGNITVNHSLGSVPGFVTIKRTDGVSAWLAYHTSLGNNQYVYLNATNAAGTLIGIWNATSTTFTANAGFAAGAQVILYLWASNAGGFGLTGTDNVISCGSASATGITAVSLGYEPQFCMLKRSDGTGGWFMTDTMRGWNMVGDVDVRANVADAETDRTGSGWFPSATGFTFDSAQLNGSGDYIYIAIRRGPMKVPTDGTKVFNNIARTGTGAVAQVTGVGFSPDLSLSKSRLTGVAYGWYDKLRGVTQYLRSSATSQEATETTDITSFNMDGVSLGDGLSTQLVNSNSASQTYINHYLKRAPGFFDEVCYTGTGSATTFSHNLAAVPELMIVKKRSASGTDWNVYHSALGNTQVVFLDLTNATATAPRWNDTTPTASVFSIGSHTQVNESGATFVWYGFATCPGVSKVGSYTGTGTTLQINCGFTGGARFVLIKRTDSTGDWYVWDSARGIVAGNDPYLLLNSTAAEVTGTDYVDTFSSGFEISSTAPAAINANGGTFIFLAIA